MRQRQHNIANQQFNRLTAIKEIPERYIDGHIFWEFLCSCGNLKIIQKSAVVRGRVHSCGCLTKEVAAERLKGKPAPNRAPKGEANANRLFANYKNGAQKRNLSFNLSKGAFLLLTKQNCHYCGIEPKQIKDDKYRNGPYIYNGIDRKDNVRGYEIDNCVSCCGTCNLAKLHKSYDGFIEWIKNAAKWLKENNR